MWLVSNKLSTFRVEFWKILHVYINSYWWVHVRMLHTFLFLSNIKQRRMRNDSLLLILIFYGKWLTSDIETPFLWRLPCSWCPLWSMSAILLFLNYFYLNTPKNKPLIKDMEILLFIPEKDTRGIKVPNNYWNSSVGLVIPVEELLFW